VQRRKWTVFGLGAVGLASALTLAAFVAPNRTAAAAKPYTPADPAAIVAHVPARDPAEVAARQAFAASPDDIALAVKLARADIGRYRALSDPRYLGRAQATLARWWSLPAPPADVRLLRGIIEQSIHQFPAARADLDAVIAERPADGQALLTRAVVATVTADYAAARTSCAAVAKLADRIVAATCIAPLDALSDPEGAYKRLAAVINDLPPGVDKSVRTWALTTLGEIAVMRGATNDAELVFMQAQIVDEEDNYGRDALADVYLRAHRYAEASTLLAGREVVDGHLVRRAIAEHLGHGPDAEKLAKMMRERIAAAAERGDRVHLREEAMFALVVEGDAKRAVALAIENWGVQKELADARLLVAAATAAGTPEAAAPVRAWIDANHVHDAILGGAP
jgi:hypothetical protein